MTTPDDDSTRTESPPPRRVRWPRLLLIAVLLYLVGSNVWTQIKADDAQVTATEATQGEREAQQQAKSLAEQVAEACARGGAPAEALGAACEQARDLQREPAAPPRDGRGITGTTIADGRLLITYTDGVVEDKGPVAGEDGKPGRGIAGSAITSAGRLVLTYTDGTTEDVGVVVGPDGKDGKDGRGVVSVTVSPDFHLIVSYDDGSTADAGQLPSGPKGDPGRGIESVSFDMDSCTATVTYTDGTSEPAPMTGCEEPDPDPSDPADPPGGLLPGGN